MSPAMSAISFVMDGVAHAANDGFVLDTGLSHCSKYRQFKPRAVAPSTTQIRATRPRRHCFTTANMSTVPTLGNRAALTWYKLNASVCCALSPPIVSRL
jgi:hypothetical protein